MQPHMLYTRFSQVARLLDSETQHDNGCTYDGPFNCGEHAYIGTLGPLLPCFQPGPLVRPLHCPTQCL